MKNTKDVDIFEGINLKDMDMFKCLKAEEIPYFFGFLAGIISVAKKNNKSSLDITLIEAAIESAKRQSKEYTAKLINN